jgi:hypothetical protein
MFFEIPLLFKAEQNSEIYKNGVLFYKTLKNKTFSLPVGNYEIKGKIYPIGVYNYQMKLKPFDKMQIKNYKFFYGKNENCASVFDDGTVILDHKFNDPSPVNLALILHEIAHGFYNTELDCDLFAIEILKSVGFNDTQIKAMFTSGTKTDRIKEIDKKLKK